MLIGEILKDYSGFTFTQNVGKGQKIDKPLFQYQETDWNFLKRIASELSSELYCDVINLTTAFYFGLPSKNTCSLTGEVEYDAVKDLRSFYEAKGSGNDYNDIDYFYYKVKAEDILEIGAKINYKDKDLYVREL